MSTDTRKYLSCAETAKLVRKALKADFPGVKFRVRSSTYAVGASIDVGWTDGPTERQVRGTLALYAGGSFDGSIDLMSYHDSILIDENGAVECVSFGADFVHGQRTISAEWFAEMAAAIEAATGEACDLTQCYDMVERDGEQVRAGYNGDGWNTKYDAAVIDGEIKACGNVNDCERYGGRIAQALAQCIDRRTGEVVERW
jgi:hypothetical protein